MFDGNENLDIYNGCGYGFCVSLGAYQSTNPLVSSCFIMFHHVSSAENIGQQPIYPSINGTCNQISSNIHVISYHKSIISMNSIDSMDCWPGNIDNGGSTTRHSGHRPGPDFTRPTELLVLDTKPCIFCLFHLEPHLLTSYNYTHPIKWFPKIGMVPQVPHIIQVIT